MVPEGGQLMRFGRDGNGEGRDPLTGRRIEPVDDTPLLAMQQELAPGEKLIWADRPMRMASFARRHIAQAVFGIPFFAFAVFWTVMAFSMTSGAGGDMNWLRYVFPLFGIPFILVGAGLLLSPLHAAFAGRRIIYGLTDRRVITREGRGKVTSFDLADLDAIERRDHRDGMGDIVYRHEQIIRSRGSHTRQHGFYGIREAQRVEQAIRRAREELRDEAMERPAR
ncbi:MAG: hypothetical protein WAT70_04945 [Rhizobiaceae bacterium]